MKIFGPNGILSKVSLRLAVDFSAPPQDFEVAPPGTVRAHQGHLPSPGKARQREFSRLVFHTDPRHFITLSPKVLTAPPATADLKIEPLALPW
jgi:hypothetical protein